MPEQLETFTFVNRKPRPTGKFDSILDGKIWKVLPSEFDYEDENPKAFMAAVKVAAKREKNRYVLCNTVLSGHVILQMQAEDYVPSMLQARVAKAEKAEKRAAAQATAKG